MRKWNSGELCAFARITMPHRPEFRLLNPKLSIEMLLERINTLVDDDPRVMMINARVEIDLGRVTERLAEGAEPDEGDAFFSPTYRLVFGRLGTRTFLLPFFPQEPPDSIEYASRLVAIMERLPDGTHPNAVRSVAMPTRGARTYAAITFYTESGGDREFARFAWRADMDERDAAWLLKDAWARLCRHLDARRFRPPALPS
jgi:hypothetical protein